MLVLSRRHRESVVIGGADGFPCVLKVTVLEIHGGKVKLGFDVDATVPVHRAEVWDRVHARDQAGSAPPPTQRAPPPVSSGDGLVQHLSAES